MRSTRPSDALAGTVPCADELVHVLRGASPYVFEHIISLGSLLTSWSYDVTVVGPLTKRSRTELGRVGVAGVDITLPASAALGEQLSAARTIAGLFADRRVSLIHAHGFQAALSALLARRSLRSAAPIVCTPHELPFLYSESTRGMWRRRAYRWVLRRCDAVIASSDTQRRQIATLDPTSARQATVVPYGIDPRRYRDPLSVGRRRQLLGINPSAAVVGCVGEMVRGSPLELFFDAAALLCRRLPNLEFAIIGAGPHQDYFREIAHSRGLLGAAAFLGEREDPTQVLNALNVLAIPQAGWPAGMLALQALACGLGVIAVPGGEAEEMVANVPGVTIVSSADATALADGIRRQLESEADAMPTREDPKLIPAELSPFLVSRQFYDLDRPWQSRVGAAGTINDTGVAAVLDAFSVTQMARNTVAVYHELLDRSSGK